MNPCCVATVGLKRSADASAINALWRPGGSFVWFLVHSATQRPGGAMGVRLQSTFPTISEWADNFGLRREPRSKFRLKMACGSNRSQRCSGHFRIWAEKAGDQVTLESANRSLSSVATMDARGHKLVFCVLGIYPGFQNCGAFIVKSVQLWPQACIANFGVKCFART